MTKITISYEGDLRTQAIHAESGSVLQTDAPRDNQGKGENFSPTDLLAVALGSCVLTLMGIAAKKLKVSLGKLRAVVEKEMSQTPPRMVSRIVVNVYSAQTFDPAIASALETAGIQCPVHHSLHEKVKQEVVFHWGEK